MIVNIHVLSALSAIGFTLYIIGRKRRNYGTTKLPKKNGFEIGVNFKKYSQNEYFSVVSKKQLPYISHGWEFQSRDNFMEQLKTTFDPRTDCIVKAIINNDTEIFIQEYQALKIWNPDFVVMNNINISKLDNFIEELNNFVNIV